MLHRNTYAINGLAGNCELKKLTSSPAVVAASDKNVVVYFRIAVAFNLFKFWPLIITVELVSGITVNAAILAL